MRRGADGAEVTGRAGRGALNDGRAGLDGVARPERPRRWTLPITALRVTPPSCLAIWLADRPSSQSLFSISTRSSVQPMARLHPPSDAPDPGIQHLVPQGPIAAPFPLDIVNIPLIHTIGAPRSIHRINM